MLAPWILLVQSTGLHSIFLRAQHWKKIERELICFVLFCFVFFFYQLILVWLVLLVIRTNL